MAKRASLLAVGAGLGLAFANRSDIRDGAVKAIEAMDSAVIEQRDRVLARKIEEVLCINGIEGTFKDTDGVVTQEGILQSTDSGRVGFHPKARIVNPSVTCDVAQGILPYALSDALPSAMQATAPAVNTSNGLLSFTPNSPEEAQKWAGLQHLAGVPFSESYCGSTVEIGSGSGQPSGVYVTRRIDVGSVSEGFLKAAEVLAQVHPNLVVNYRDYSGEVCRTMPIGDFVTDNPSVEKR